jgi:hypothetical protein
MEKDEAELVQQLRALDRQVPFDADVFAARVAAKRSRRRNRPFVSGGCIIAAMLLVGLVWQVFHDTEPRVVVNEEIQGGGTSSTDDVSPKEQTDEITRSMLANFDQQQQMDSLLGRIENAKATMAASRTERHHQLLAVYRAELSGDIEVPDLSQLYVGKVGNPAN